ncbi:hypothetical protein ACL9RL_18025 [Plantibacter sp. Mn2098]|uniref:hypothetical protein n=1 Tax=Plantibacter sp. Mn2098 TaxID=3395266 RepID=UPI003BC01A7D
MTHTAPERPRTRSRRRPITALALLLAVSTLTSSPTGTVGAASTERSTIAGNRFSSDPTREDPYGLHNAKFAPYLGSAWVDGAKGAFTFDIYDGPASVAPKPYPDVRAGEQIEVIAELPASLRFTSEYGWCNPTEKSEARDYVTITCSTVAHPTGAATATVTMTAKTDLNTERAWRLLKHHTIGVIAPAGLVDGTDTAHVTIRFPDDADHRRPQAADLPFTTRVGQASSLTSLTPYVLDDRGNSKDVAFYTGDKGYLRISTGLNGTNRGVTMKTGESFTYTSDLVSGARGGLVYDPHPDPMSTVVNACTRKLDGYDIRCEADGYQVKLITTRTGPAIVNDHPIDEYARVPVVSTYSHPSSGNTRKIGVHVRLSADMEQLGSRSRWEVLPSPDFYLFPSARGGIGVHTLALTPYLGEVLASDGTGRLTFGFFRPDAGSPASSIIKAGDTVTAALQLGTGFTVMTDPSGSEQGDAMRNWCDGIDDGWGPGLAGLLGTPSCTSTTDENGGTVVTVAVTALQDVPNANLSGGFQVRVRAADPVAAGTQQVVVELSSSNRYAVNSSFRRAVLDVPTDPSPAGASSSLGVWQTDAFTHSSGGTAPKEGAITWSPDPLPGEHWHSVWPMAITTGDTITYRVTLPPGLAYLPSPTDGTPDVCTLPDRYVGFSASCTMQGSTIEYTLTRTGADSRAMFIDRDLPFSIPVRNTGAGDEVAGEVEITLSISLMQSGSDHRRALVPVRLAASAVPQG